MSKCTCILIHTVLLGTHVRFQVLFYSNVSFFLPFFQFFLKESNWENLGSELGKKKILFCIGNGAEYRPETRQIESRGRLTNTGNFGDFDWGKKRCNFTLGLGSNIDPYSAPKCPLSLLMALNIVQLS